MILISQQIKLLYLGVYGLGEFTMVCHEEYIPGMLMTLVESVDRTHDSLFITIIFALPF